MLTLNIPDIEYWDELNQEFVSTKKMVVQLEHSLISIFKWEGIKKRSFLSEKELSSEDFKLYIRCMMITQKVSDLIVNYIFENLTYDIKIYMEDSHTATTIHELMKNKQSKQIITAEYMYYWLTTMNIPWEAARWHLNRMLTLIKVIEIENNPKKKMSKKDNMAHHRAMVKARQSKK